MIVRSMLLLAMLLSLVNSVWAVPLESENTFLFPQSEDPAYRLGLEKLVKGDLTAAEQAFRASQANHPGAANSLLGLAEIAFQRKQIDEAGRLIQQAVNVDPNNAFAQMSLGRYLRLKKQYPNAEQAFKKAADLDLKAVVPRMAIGDLYLTQFGKPEAAVSAYESALNIDPNHAAAHYALGVAQAKLGNSERSVAELHKAGELEPNNPLPSMELARVNLILKKPDDALSAVNQAIKIDPNLVEAELLRGDILLAKGDVGQAEKTYADLANRHNKLAAPRLRLAMLQQQQGQNDAAIKSYQAVIKANPKVAPAYNNLAWLLSSQKKNYSEAESMGRKAVELAPETAQYQDTLGWICRANGELAEARAVLEKAVQLAPDEAGINAHLGIVLKESGENAKAIELLKKALGTGKDFPEATEAKSVLNEIIVKK